SSTNSSTYLLSPTHPPAPPPPPTRRTSALSPPPTSPAAATHPPTTTTAPTNRSHAERWPPSSTAPCADNRRAATTPNILAVHVCVLTNRDPSGDPAARVTRHALTRAGNRISEVRVLSPSAPMPRDSGVVAVPTPRPPRRCKLG